MTENEARQKWCPSVRTGAGAPGSGVGAFNNRGQAQTKSNRENPVISSCIASDCMAWRWEQEPIDTEHRHRIGLGYCGLAGKP